MSAIKTEIRRKEQRNPRMKNLTQDLKIVKEKNKDEKRKKKNVTTYEVKVSN